MDRSTSISSRDAGGRPTAGSGPRCPISGVAEAGEVDRRIQIPIDGDASVAATVNAFMQAEFGFRSAARTQLSRSEKPGRGHQLGAIPKALIAELPKNTADSSITQGAVETAFAQSAAPAQVLGGQILDHHHGMPGGQGSGGPVYLMSTDRGHPSMNSAHPAVGTLPPVGGLSS